MRISDWSSDVCSSDLFTQEFLAQRFGPLNSSAKTELDRLEKLSARASSSPKRRSRLAKVPNSTTIGAQATIAATSPLPAICRIRSLKQNPFRWPTSCPRMASLIAVYGRTWRRSEEHTSELQSLMRISYAVFCLKKKKRNTKR